MVTSLESSSTRAVRSTSRASVTSTRRAWNPSPATVATASVARWRRSWWSTSATAQFSLRSAAATPLTTERLSFRELASGRRRSRRSSATNIASSRDLDHLECFDLVAFLDILEVLQADAALVAGRDRAGVLLEAAQRADPPLVDDHAVADQPCPRASGDLAGGDVRAGDHPDPRHPEELPDLGGAELALLVLGGQQALQRLLDVLDHLVDDRVQADVHALAGGQVAGGRGRPDREADDDRAGRGGEGDVVLGDGAGGLVQDAQPHLGHVQLAKRVVDGLDRAHHVGLDHQWQLLELALADPGEQVLQARRAAAGDRRLALARLPGLGDRAGDPLVGDGPDLVAGARGRRQADDLDRLRGDGGGDLLAVLVEHRPDPPVGGAGDHRVADLQGAAADQDGGDRAAALVQVRLDDRPLGAPVGVGLEVQLDVGDQQDRLDQGVEVLLGLGRDVDELGLAAVLLGDQVVRGELLADPGRVGLWLVDLVDRHHDRHTGRLGVVDRLHGLGHDAVVGGHHQHGDVGDGRAACPHGGERLVARRVDERHQAPVLAGPDLVGTDVLGDAAGLGRDHVGVADGVQQLGLAVVDVAHDRHHRWARLQVLVAVGLGVLPALDLVQDVGLARVDDLDPGADLLGEQGHGLVRHRLGGGQHLAHLHEQPDQVAGGLADAVGEILHGDAARHPHDALDRDVGRGLDGGGAHGLELLAPTPAPALLRPRTATEAAAAGRTATTGTAAEPGTAATAATGGAGATAAGGTLAHTRSTLAGLAGSHPLLPLAAGPLAHAWAAGLATGLAGSLALAGTTSARWERAGARRQRATAWSRRTGSRGQRTGTRRQRPHPRRQRATLAGLARTGTRRQRPHPRRQRPHPRRQRASLAGLRLAGLPRPRRPGLARSRLAGLPRPRLAGLAGSRLAGAALGGLGGAAGGRRCARRSRGLSLTGLGRPALAAAALERGTQLLGDVRRHRRGVALYLHPHGGQLGEQVLVRDPKLLGNFVDPRVAQPDLTSSRSLERRLGAAAGLPNALRSASMAPPTAAVSVTFNARWMLPRLSAASRQAGCPQR